MCGGSATAAAGQLGDQGGERFGQLEATDPDAIAVPREVWPLLTTLAGVDPHALPPGATTERMRRVIVARWLVNQEYAVLHAHDRWGDAATAAAFLDRLVATTGYTLSEAEQTLLDVLQDRLKPPPPPRETPEQLDASCEECGAEEQEPCEDDCPLRFAEPGDQTDTDDGDTAQDEPAREAEDVEDDALNPASATAR